MTYLTSFEIGASMESMVNVESLAAATLPPPRAPFSPYAATRQLADGNERGIGAPICEWNFGVLTQAQRDALRTYCAGASASVFIRTKTNDTTDSFKYFSAVLLWPQGFDENRESFGTRVDFIIKFRMLILQADPIPPEE